MRREPADVLLSPVFAGGLCLLLLNDFVLKEQFHNALTGKLSDFAGLLVFALFWTALCPRFKAAVHVFIALAFIFWKSAYAQSLIDGWNGFAPFSLGRTVDATDLLALSVLPVSYVYESRARRLASQRGALYLISAVSVFAFTATSFRSVKTYTNQYVFEGTKAELVERMSRLSTIDFNNRKLAPENEPDYFEVDFGGCIERAEIGISATGGQSTIKLDKMIFVCPRGGDQQEMLEFFEREFIAKLREPNPVPTERIRHIWWATPPRDAVSPSPSTGRKPAPASSVKR